MITTWNELLPGWWPSPLSNIFVCKHINVYLKWVQVLLPPPYHLMEMDRPFSQVNHCIYPPPQHKEEAKDSWWIPWLLQQELIISGKKLPGNMLSSDWHVTVMDYTHITDIITTNLPAPNIFTFLVLIKFTNCHHHHHHYAYILMNSN